MLTTSVNEFISERSICEHTTYIEDVVRQSEEVTSTLRTLVGTIWVISVHN